MCIWKKCMKNKMHDNIIFYQNGYLNEQQLDYGTTRREEEMELLGDWTLSSFFPFSCPWFLTIVSSMFDLWVCTKYKCLILHILGKIECSHARNFFHFHFHLFYDHSTRLPFMEMGNKVKSYVMRIFSLGSPCGCDW